MAAIDFPDSPTLGQTLTVGEKTWTWNGSYWISDEAITGLDGLNDVTITTPVDGDVVQYDNGEFVNSPVDYTDLTSVPNDFTPTTHASTHESGGSDEIEIAQSQVTGLDAGTEGFTALSNGSSGLSYQPVSHNYIINGAFDIWQRGDGPFTSDEYTADRWRQERSGATFSTTIQEFTLGELDAIGYGQAKNYLRLNATTGNKIASISTRLEDGRTLSGQDFTVSFYAKGTNPSGGNLDLRVFQRLDSGTVTAMQGSFTLTSSWQRFEFSGPMPSVAGKTITENNHIEVQFRQPFGDTSTDAWELNLWGVQLEAGSIATPFKRNANSIAGELAACQRYYWRSELENNQTFGQGLMTSSSGGRIVLQHPVPMRVEAIDFEYQNLIAYDGSSTFSGGTISKSSAGSKLYPALDLAGYSGMTEGQFITLYATTGGYVAFGAEL